MDQKIFYKAPMLFLFFSIIGALLPSLIDAFNGTLNGLEIPVKLMDKFLFNSKMSILFFLLFGILVGLNPQLLQKKRKKTSLSPP